jgi:hypothetical protein
MDESVTRQPAPGRDVLRGSRVKRDHAQHPTRDGAQPPPQLEHQIAAAEVAGIPDVGDPFRLSILDHPIRHDLVSPKFTGSLRPSPAIAIRSCHGRRRRANAKYREIRNAYEQMVD